MRDGCALVTGASRGIGAATARALAEDGWPVGINYRADADGAASVVAEIESTGGRAVPLEADISDGLPFGDGMFDAVVSSFGLSCVPRISPALDEILRVLRQDGVIAVGACG